MKEFIVFSIIALCVIGEINADTCATGFVQSSAGIINAYTSVNNSCHPGDTLVPVRNAYITNIQSYGCGPGYYYDGTQCTAHALGDGCPTNYYTPSTVFTRANANGTCSSGNVYNGIPICAVKIGDSSAGVCTPQLACESGGITLRTSNGVALPLWRERLTIPSLNVGFENGDICYINILPGTAPGTINFGSGNNVYHGVE